MPTKPTDPPEQTPSSTDEERFSITLDRRSYEMAEFVATHWNCIDKVREVKRYRDWGVTNVCPPSIRASVANVAAKLGGYPPSKDEQRDALVRGSVDKLLELNPQMTEATARSRAEEIVDETLAELAEDKRKRAEREAKKKRRK